MNSGVAARLGVGLAVVVGMRGMASGQLIGKVPPASAPAPAYVPPAPLAPPAPPKPAEPEKPLPVLGVKGADGKLKRYAQGAERAAMEMYEFDAETRKKIAAAEVVRNADVERMVIEKLEKVLEARKTMVTLDQTKDFNEFDRIKQVAAPLSVERLGDRLMRDGAINAMERSRVDQMVKEYEKQLGDEIRGETGTDLPKIVGAVAKSSFVNGTRDAFAALDRLMKCGAEKVKTVGGELGLTADQVARSASEPFEKFFFEMMTQDQQKMLMGKCVGSGGK